MAYRDLVKAWHEGVLALEKGDGDSALKVFSSLENPPSRIEFNLGCIHLERRDLRRALEAFDRTVSKDTCLAIGFYQRGYVCLLLERYEEALNSFQLALVHLRSNTCINYKQLGLKVVLCAWEVLYNTAVAHSRLGRWQEAQRLLEEALEQTPRDQAPYLDVALQQVQEHLLLDPRSIPRGEIFRPPKKDVEELGAKDFLGQAKVISSVFKEDISGFHGLHPQNLGSGLPPPPENVPPTRPHESQRRLLPGATERTAERVGANGTGPETALEQVSSAHGEAPQSNGRPILLKVHGSYTVNVKASTAVSLADLGVLLREEVCRQAEEMTLRYRSPSSNEFISLCSEEELRMAWQEAEDGHLTLWCQGKKDSRARPVLYRMVARHAYAGQGLADLSFKEGDTLEILSEVNEEWLEGRCHGTIGIFPKCFAVREDSDATHS